MSGIVFQTQTDCETKSNIHLCSLERNRRTAENMFTFTSTEPDVFWVQKQKGLKG